MGPLLVLFGAVIGLLGASFYIKDTLAGKTKPNRVTWLLWSIAPLIGTAAALADGVRWAVLPVFIAGFAPFLVFLASFANSKAYWKLSPFDYWCGFFSLFALILWWLSKEPAIAILLAIISDGLAALPTIIKSWHHPHTESSIVFSTGLINSFTSFTVITAWTFSEYAFPAYLVGMNALLLFAIYRKKATQFFA